MASVTLDALAAYIAAQPVTVGNVRADTITAVALFARAQNGELVYFGEASNPLDEAGFVHGGIKLYQRGDRKGQLMTAKDAASGIASFCKRYKLEVVVKPNGIDQAVFDKASDEDKERMLPYLGVQAIVTSRTV